MYAQGMRGEVRECSAPIEIWKVCTKDPKCLLFRSVQKTCSAEVCADLRSSDLNYIKYCNIYTRSLQLCPPIAATVCNEHTFSARLPRPCVNNLNRSTNGFHSLLCVASPGWGNAVAASLQNVCRGKRKKSKEKNGWEGLLRTTFQKYAPNIVINY